MPERNTDDLKQELMTAPDLGKFIEKNRKYFQERDMVIVIEEVFRGKPMSKSVLGVRGIISEVYRRKHMSKSALAARANISEVYLHQVFAGQRRLSRDRLLCVCVGMSATLDETQGLLKECGFAQLYVKNRRDAVIMYGMLHGMDLEQINDRLFDAGEASLC